MAILRQIKWWDAPLTLCNLAKVRTQRGIHMSVNTINKFLFSGYSEIETKRHTWLWTRDWNDVCMINDIVIILLVKGEQIDVKDCILWLENFLYVCNNIKALKVLSGSKEVHHGRWRNSRNGRVKWKWGFSTIVKITTLCPLWC